MAHIARRRRIPCALLTGAVALAALTAATPQQIFPDPASGEGGRVVIAVLSDHFTSAEEHDFNVAANNFVKYSLMVDPDYYGPKAHEFRFVRVFDAWTPSPTGPESNFEFEIGAGGDCSIGWTANTEGLINDALPDDLVPIGTIVIGNHGYNFGCAYGSWVYVTTGSVGNEVLQHELGHMIGELYDEFAIPSTRPDPYPNVPPHVIPANDDRNCALAGTTAHWHNRPNVTNPPACDLFRVGVFHPYDQCRMGRTQHPEFCKVCRDVMDRGIEIIRNQGVPNPDVTNPQPVAPAAPTGLRIVPASFVSQLPAPKPEPPQQPAGTPPPAQPPAAAAAQASQPQVRIVIGFSPSAASAVVKRATDATGRYVPNYRKTGQYVYEVSEAGKTLAVGVVPSRLFQSRSYSGGVTEHAATNQATADIIVSVPGETVKGILAQSRSVQVAFYQLTQTIDAPLITPAAWSELKQRNQAKVVVQIPSEALKKALQ